MNLKNFYSGKRILVTGHTGFKGAWLCLVLHQMGANVKGISLPPDDRRGNFYKILKLKNKVDSSYIDIRNYRKLEQAVKKNLITMIYTNAPPAVAPHGALKSLFGTNPICFGSPTGSKIPFILDTSISVINRGKIRVAARNNQSIPAGVALDKFG